MAATPHNKKKITMIPETNLIIDPHLHLFALNEGEYHWLRSDGGQHWPDKHLIQKDFTYSDLTLAKDFRLMAVSHIEAGFNNQQPALELKFLEQQLKHKIYRAVAYIDITSATANFEKQLAILLSEKNLAGIRHITEGEDINLLFSSNIANNLRILAKHNLIFEAQFEISNLAASQRLVQLASALPELTIVINHAGLVTEQNDQLWLEAVNLIEPHKNINMKCSGWEMVNRDYSQTWVKHVITVLIEKLGSNRLMFASNFPLCLLSKSYETIWRDYLALDLKPDDWHKLSFVTANRIYFNGNL